MAQNEVRQLYQEAQAARTHGHLEEAEHKYVEVIHQAPQFANACQNLGIVYFMLRKYSDAAATFEKTIKLSPRLAAAHAMLGLAYYELYQADKAVSAFETALRLNPADTNALLFSGKSQIQAHDYSAAARNLEKAAVLKPGDPDVFYNLSLAHMKLMVEAVNHLGEVAPGSYQLLPVAGAGRGESNQDSAAVKYYLSALHLKPDGVGLHYALGSVYARTGRYDEAAGEFKKELQINPNDSLALWKLGEVTLRTNAQDARDFLERAIQLNPELPQVILAYGRALAHTGETQKAIEQFRRVVRLASEEPSVHYHLANAYRNLGRTDEARAEILDSRNWPGKARSGHKLKRVNSWI